MSTHYEITNPGAPYLDGTARQSLCMDSSEKLRRDDAGTSRSPATFDRGDAIREIAENLERLCIEYDCQGRVSPGGIGRRAVWAAFKAEIEALKEMA